MGSSGEVRQTVVDGIKKEAIKALHGTLIDLLALMNQPQRDDTLLKEAGIKLDRALFPLLVGIERFGPIGVGDLAERVGRDYTTVSRQVGKLKDLGLIDRKSRKDDRRINEAVITAQGRVLTRALDEARLRLASLVFSEWPESEFTDLVRLMRRFVDDLKNSG